MNVGGPSRHVTILATGCAPEFDTTLLIGTPDSREGSLADEAAKSGARVVEVPRLHRAVSPFADAIAFVWLFRYFRRERPAIVATHMAKAGTVGRLAAAIAGVPITVHTFHGHVLDGYFGRLSSSFYLAVERMLARLTTCFVAISPEVAADLKTLRIGRGKTTIVRLGLELDHLVDAKSGTLRAELGIAADTPVIGFVGRLVPIKAVDLFLEAAARVLATRPTARFVIVGDGELWEALHRRAEQSDLAGKVNFTGWRKDLSAIYPDLDLVVCCSRNEGTPVSLIEACAAGRPVIGTRVGGVTDIIAAGVNGLLVESGDAEGLSNAICQLIDDPAARRRMGAAGQQAVVQRYGADRMIRELKSLYQSLVERSAVKPEAA